MTDNIRQEAVERAVADGELPHHIKLIERAIDAEIRDLREQLADCKRRHIDSVKLLLELDKLVEQLAAERVLGDRARELMWTPVSREAQAWVADYDAARKERG